MKKKTALRLFFVAEIILFSWFYYFGPHGMKAVACIQQENSLVEKQIAIAQQHVTTLEAQVVAWQNNDFLKEKVAREQLQLARQEDIIYVLD